MFGTYREKLQGKEHETDFQLCMALCVFSREKSLRFDRAEVYVEDEENIQHFSRMQLPSPFSSESSKATTGTCAV